eukprot:2980088-Rhodomonas_salina.2
MCCVAPTPDTQSQYRTSRSMCVGSEHHTAVPLRIAAADGSDVSTGHAVACACVVLKACDSKQDSDLNSTPPSLPTTGLTDLPARPPPSFYFYSTRFLLNPLSTQPGHFPSSGPLQQRSALSSRGSCLPRPHFPYSHLFRAGSTAPSTLHIPFALSSFLRAGGD